MEEQKKQEPEYKKVRRSLQGSILEGSFAATMEGFTSHFISAYGLFLGASNLAISFLSSAPDLVASFFQMVAIKISEIFQSKKKLLAVGAFIQALLWIPILLIPKLVSTQNQAYALILLYSLIVMFNYFLSPLWRGLMGDLVPESERGSYFGKRNKITAVVSFVSTLAAGFILQHFSKTNPFIGFAILFSVACVSRIASSIIHANTYERDVHNPNFHHYPEYKYTLSRFFKDLTKTDYGKFVLFVCLFRIAVNISSPFQAIYELKHLGFSYFQFTTLIMCEIVSSILFMSLWGKLNDEKGSKRVMIVSGLLIPFIPLLYLVTESYYFFLVISLVSGAAWAGFNLAVGNFLFDASSPHERVRYTAYFNMFHGVSIFIGAMAGGFILTHLPDTGRSFLILFAVSFVARLAVVLLMLPKFHELRLVELKFGKSMFQYPLIVKPRQRFVQDPFDYYLAYPSKPKKTRPRLYLDTQFTSEPKDPEKERLEKWKLKKFMERYTPPADRKK